MDMERHGTHEKNTDLEGKVGSTKPSYWHITNVPLCIQLRYVNMSITQAGAVCFWTLSLQSLLAYSHGSVSTTVINFYFKQRRHIAAGAR